MQGDLGWTYPFRILVAVTFHFRRSRLQYLFQVIRSLSEFPVELLDVVVITNVDSEPLLDQIRDLCKPLFEDLPLRRGSQKGFSIESHPNLTDPWHLTWCHKHLITEKFIGAKTGYTHFLYTEDDILISFDNLCYFLHFREVLRDQGLIPSFQRIEYNGVDNRLYLLDQVGVSHFASRKRIDSEGYAFVNLSYPYNAMFVLDQALAIEYVATKSFDRNRSKDVQPEWGTAERAAMGLCFEGVPPGYTTRYVSPVDPTTLLTPRWCWIYHITGNYVKNRLKPFAKTRVDHLFETEDNRVPWREPSKLSELFHRARRRVTRIFGN